MHFYIFLFLNLASAAIPAPRNNNAQAISTLYEFPRGAWVENIAVRSNGQLLITRTDVPELYLVDPLHPSPSLVHRFTSAMSLLGITEVAHDIFAVVAGKIDLATASAVPGSFVIWKVDMRSAEAAVLKIAEIPEALFLNGMTLYNAKTSTVLIADSKKGVIWRLDMQTGRYSIALADTTMKPAANSPIQIGVNGIKFRGGFVYYTSSTKKLFCRVAVNAALMAVGPFETIASGFFGDDFTLRQSDGMAYIESNIENTVIQVTPAGMTSVVAGNLNSSLVAGPTAALLGRTKLDCNILYITTSGAQAAPVNGTYTEGGKIIALDLNKLDN